MQTNARHGRKAISPIIATVLIIAITLIAAVAIGGFVFGLFGSSQNTAQISVTQVACTHSNVVGSTACGTIDLTNSGTVPATATAGAITYGGSTYALTVTSVVIPATGVSTGVTATLPGTAAVSSAGQQYTGYIVLSNGAQAIFTGTFQ